LAKYHNWFIDCWIVNADYWRFASYFLSLQGKRSLQMLVKNQLTFAFLVLVGFLFVSNVNAQTIFSVNTTVDSIDSSPGNGICADISGNCSIRAATMEIDSLPKTSSYGIQIPPGIYTLTIPNSVPITDVAMGDLNVNGRSVSFIGTDARTTIIQAGTIGNIIGSEGNGIDRVFGIRGDGLNSITGVVFSGLTIRNGKTISSGGGITAGNNARLVINNVTIANNTADGGGGIYLAGARLDMRNSTITGNKDRFFVRGSVYFFSLGPTSPFASSGSIVNSTISGNNSGVTTQSDCNIINSTIANNKNTAGFNGIDVTSGANFYMRNTIVVNNFSGALLDSPTDVRGAIISEGTNLVSGGFIFASGWTATDLVANFSSNLGPLANNGGQTDTHSIGSNSSALNAGQNCVFDGTCSGTLTTDQRGLPRLVDGFSPEALRVDIGAFEKQTTTAASANISGRVTTAIGRGIRSVRILLTKPTGEIVSATTNPFGYYRFQELAVGDTYVLNVSSKRHSFTQPTRVITLVEDLTGEDFITNNRY
jgi:hypothetical protein